jgi:hypothetical protein
MANNGGPAFPSTISHEEWDEHKAGYLQRLYPEAGMTLRDYFAAKAMHAALARMSAAWTYEEIAKAAYDMADAMLAERSK